VFRVLIAARQEASGGSHGNSNRLKLPTLEVVKGMSTSIGQFKAMDVRITDKLSDRDKQQLVFAVDLEEEWDTSALACEAG
jgi:hypothetical protein